MKQSRNQIVVVSIMVIVAFMFGFYSSTSNEGKPSEELAKGQPRVGAEQRTPSVTESVTEPEGGANTVQSEHRTRARSAEADVSALKEGQQSEALPPEAEEDSTIDRVGSPDYQERIPEDYSLAREAEAVILDPELGETYDDGDDITAESMANELKANIESEAQKEPDPDPQSEQALIETGRVDPPEERSE